MLKRNMDQEAYAFDDLEPLVREHVARVLMRLRARDPRGESPSRDSAHGVER